MANNDMVIVVVLFVVLGFIVSNAIAAVFLANLLLNCGPVRAC